MTAVDMFCEQYNTFQLMSPLQASDIITEYDTYIVIQCTRDIDHLVLSIPVLREHTEEIYFAPDQLLGVCHEDRKHECVESLVEAGITTYYSKSRVYTIQIPSISPVDNQVTCINRCIPTYCRRRYDYAVCKIKSLLESSDSWLWIEYVSYITANI